MFGICFSWLIVVLFLLHCRLPVVDSNGALLTIVTQSHVVDLIYKNIEKFSIAGSTVSQLKIGFKDVISVTLEDTVLDAFRLIHEKVSMLLKKLFLSFTMRCQRVL
jgi:hypothetical protein